MLFNVKKYLRDSSRDRIPIFWQKCRSHKEILLVLELLRCSSYEPLKLSFLLSSGKFIDDFSLLTLSLCTLLLDELLLPIGLPTVNFLESRQLWLNYTLIYISK
jgi:hypothetical protein